MYQADAVGHLSNMQIHLSDTAYEKLISQGRYNGHIRRDSAFGLSHYMSGLLEKNPNPSDWIDTRPEHIKAQDLDELLSDRLPIWDDGETRTKRLIKLNPTIEPELARQLGIFRIHPHHGHPLMKPAALTSEFWEVVGIGWLTPINEPTPPKYKRKVREKAHWEIEF